MVGRLAKVCLEIKNARHPLYLSFHLAGSRFGAWKKKRYACVPLFPLFSRARLQENPILSNRANSPLAAHPLGGGVCSAPVSLTNDGRRGSASEIPPQRQGRTLHRVGDPRNDAAGDALRRGQPGAGLP